MVLAGGIGRRLFPLTNITNKHLFPVYGKLTIYYLARRSRNQTGYLL